MSNKNPILAENTQRSQGRTAQNMNILAAKLVGETVRTTLGPQGMDKMIADTLGDIIITNDGATILKEMNIEHPAAKMIVEIAKTQEDEVGDGTTTVAILAGELLRQAEILIDQNIHPTTIIKGYRLAAEKSQTILENMSEKLSPNNLTILKKLSMTAMTGKVADDAKEKLSEIVVKGITKISKDGLNIDNIKIEKKVGSSIQNTELIEGVVLDKEKIHNSMPEKVKNAKIALIDTALEMKQTDTESKISITDPKKFQEFLDMEELMMKKLVNKISETGANVVLCQKGIDDMVQYLLSQKGIYTCRRVKKSDLNQVAKATNATIISNVNDLKTKDLGKAGIVSQEKISDENMTFIRECKNPQAITILVRATTEHIADEVTRAIEDAIGNVSSALRAKKVVGGAGSTEIELTRNLNHFSQKLSGKEQLAVQAFGKAFEIIPKTLAENAGIDPIDVITELKSLHDKGQKWSGINVWGGKAINSYKEGIIEPLPVKTQAIASASDVAVMILRIDDIIIAGPQEENSRGNPHEELDY